MRNLTNKSEKIFFGLNIDQNLDLNKNKLIGGEYMKSIKKERVLSGLNCDELCLLSNKKEMGKERKDKIKELAEEEMAENVCQPCE